MIRNALLAGAHDSWSDVTTTEPSQSDPVRFPGHNDLTQKTDQQVIGD
ncbi:MAG: hypothetical protein M0Q13_03045 [Methanothrix sp.]|nr:hypothetical protein [Methanothrix sp.]